MTKYNHPSSKFTHLHVHTEYSLLDGSSKIKELVTRTKELGMDSIAITDHGVMYGVIDFYKEAIAQDIKPIIGSEVYVAPRSRLNKEARIDHANYHLVLLAKNQTGYKNLMKLVSKGFTEGFYYKPRIDIELLKQYHEGLICLSACLAGEVPQSILNISYEKGKEIALMYDEIFGRGSYYLELQDHGYSEQKKVNQSLIRMSKETGIPLVATNDSHYTFKEDAKAHDILLCIQTNKKINDQNRLKYTGGQFYLKSPDEMSKLFPYIQEALENTNIIAEQCQVDFEFGKVILPKFDVPKASTPKSYLTKLCQIGLKERYINPSEQVLERLNYELSVIDEMGYIDYFLIVWDFIKYARDHEIMVGPGRGSAAGSIVAYCLSITDIDPIKYNLLFERFLNPERISMPDIDIDFCYERRQEVIDYVISKYGEDRVAQIITFGTMAARAVIRDVGRALDMPYSSVDSVAKMIPSTIGITITKALEYNPELKQLYDKDVEVKYLIDMSLRLEGLPRHSSTHAAGVVISREPVMEYVPLNSNDGAVTTQFPMTTLEELGLLKMDFLGLRTLTVIRDAIQLVYYNRNLKVKLEHLDYHDSKVFELIGSGKTDGVFQLESSGMKSFMKELQPRSLEDIIAGISLYRPGPMDFIPRYIKGKNNKNKINYVCEELIPILEPTYGCIVYQEQVMQIVRELAGYTLGRSDLVRRAMSKKKGKVMAKERQNFIYGNPEEKVLGCIHNGIPEQTAKKIFDEMTDFAKYAFNKSHAAAYAVLAYQTAWLKAYYPVEFMAALLTSIMENSTKVAEYIGTCRLMGIDILPPDVNEGYAKFSVTGDKIRYGLAAIKNVGRQAVKWIVIEREARGKFHNLTHFFERLNQKELNKRMIESLIKAGAFDSMGGNRKQYMQGYKIILDSVVHSKKRSLEGQLNLFDFAKETTNTYKQKLPEVQEFSNDDILALEKEVLGIYLSGHPLADVESEWRINTTATSLDFVYHDDKDDVTLCDGEEAIIGGLVVGKTVKTTRNNKLMAFVTLEDLYGTVEVIIFPNDFNQYKELLIEDTKLYIKGRVNMQEDRDAKLIGQTVLPFYAVKNELRLTFVDYKQYTKVYKSITKILKDNPGKHRVIAILKNEKTMKALEATKVQINTDLLNKLAKIIGNHSIKVKNLY